MSTDLKTFVEQMQASLAENPQSARVQFAAVSQQVKGLRSQAIIRNKFDVTVDEPAALGGDDLGPNPVELILAAFAACQEITYRLFAESLGIPLNKVAVTVRGKLDLRGFLGVDDNVRRGFQEVEASVTLDSPASAEDIERLTIAVEQHCPVFDILHNHTPVKLEVEQVNGDAMQEAVA